jgi:hypothetical protein
MLSDYSILLVIQHCALLYERDDVDVDFAGLFYEDNHGSS